MTIHGKTPPQNFLIFWSFIKVSERNTHLAITSLNYNGNVLVEPISKVDTLNSHFKLIFTTEDHALLSS